MAILISVSLRSCKTAVATGCGNARRRFARMSKAFKPLCVSFEPAQDNAIGAMRVEAAMGWTETLRSIAQRLAGAARSEEMNIRSARPWSFRSWAALTLLPCRRSRGLRLSSVHSMQNRYFKPAAMIGAEALCRVAGYMRCEGVLARRDVPSIVEQLNVPLPPRPLLDAQVRPRAI